MQNFFLPNIYFCLLKPGSTFFSCSFYFEHFEYCFNLADIAVYIVPKDQQRTMYAIINKNKFHEKFSKCENINYKGKCKIYKTKAHTDGLD